jgi:Spy/CpxP family protein refolding chaperone
MKRVLTVLAVALVMVAMFVATAMPAFAKIQDVDVACENPAGSEPGGQQPSCKNANLTQETEAQNPSGHAPPGQN